MSDALPKDRIRDAATVIALRRDAAGTRLLMGQRGKGAAFMPSKFVFPGGAVDAEDAAAPAPVPLRPDVADSLTARNDTIAPHALALAAVRELWEETGLALGHRSDPPVAGTGEWESFCAAGFVPALDRLDFVFRAITPPGRPRRFDARFFLVDAEAIATDPDDFGRACDELSHLSWLTLAEARRLDLPFITEVVLAEVEARLRMPDRVRGVPFFYHADGRSHMDTL